MNPEVRKMMAANWAYTEFLGRQRTPLASHAGHGNCIDIGSLCSIFNVLISSFDATKSYSKRRLFFVAVLRLYLNYQYNNQQPYAFQTEAFEPQSETVPLVGYSDFEP